MDLYLPSAKSAALEVQKDIDILPIYVLTVIRFAATLSIRALTGARDRAAGRGPGP